MFLLLAVLIADILEHVSDWQLIPYIAVPITVVFLITDATFRYKSERFIFG
jgi:hypothetical protein